MDTNQQERRHLDEGAIQSAQGAIDASLHSLRKVWRCVSLVPAHPGRSPARRRLSWAARNTSSGSWF